MRYLRRSDGFTLIEVMAALTVFALITLGIIPVLATSMRAATLARTYTVGKNAGLKSMERIRGLPYYISYAAQPQRVDILDLYFPGTTSAAPKQVYNGGNFSYTTICEAGSALPACPKDLPDDYTVTFVAQFVEANGSGSSVTYDPVPPAAGYTWNSATNLDLPPTQLLLMKVTTSWTAANRARSYSMTSLLSDRKFGDVKVEGSTKISYGLQALTTLRTGGNAELVAKLGISESNIQTHTASFAKQIVTGGTLTLTESTGGGGTAQLLDDYTGVDVAYDGPPTQNPVSSSAGAGVVERTDVVGEPDYASLGSTTAQGPTPGLKVTIENELPEARGGFSFNAAAGQDDLWVNTETDFVSKHLEPTQRVLSVRPRPLGTETGASGSTFAQTFGLGTASRGVQTNATVTVNQLQLLPTTFIPSGSRSVVEITNFTATVDCKATASAASAVATPTWSATLKFWADTANNGVNLGAYQTLSLSGNAATDLLQSYGTGAGQTNPLVYDDVDNEDDIYLFDNPAVDRDGYLQGWSSLHNVTTTGFRKSGDGKAVSADIGGALRIDTAATEEGEPTSGLQLALGSLSCSAVDKR